MREGADCNTQHPNYCREDINKTKAMCILRRSDRVRSISHSPHPVFFNGELSSAIGGAASLENWRSLNRLGVGSSTLRLVVNHLLHLGRFGPCLFLLLPFVADKAKAAHTRFTRGTAAFTISWF